MKLCKKCGYTLIYSTKLNRYVHSLNLSDECPTHPER